MTINRPDSRECKYCGKKMRACGLPSHIHFRHIGMVLFELRASMASPYWQFFIYGELQPFRHKQLTEGDR
jgi:hypothetical protein